MKKAFFYAVLMMISSSIMAQITGDGSGPGNSETTISEPRSFSPEPGETYIVSAWTKEDNPQQQMSYTHCYCEMVYSLTETVTFVPSGAIIDDWQRITGTFTVPANAASFTLRMVASDPSIDCYFDDVRVFPFNGNMKSFVYDPITQRLMAELDENNYATFYEYDLEGGLVRIKKETEEGVKTIQETRSGNAKGL